jgi:hypothetical protein
MKELEKEIMDQMLRPALSEIFGVVKSDFIIY